MLCTNKLEWFSHLGLIFVTKVRKGENDIDVIEQTHYTYNSNV
jgi:hypothetical protein